MAAVRVVVKTDFLYHHPYRYQPPDKESRRGGRTEMERTLTVVDILYLNRGQGCAAVE